MTPADFLRVFDVDLDAGTLHWREPPKNHAEKLGRLAGYVSPTKGKNKRYWAVRAFGRTFKRSRLIFFVAHGRWPEPAVDHINGDSLDDGIANLRECSLSENAANSKPKTRSTELPAGVHQTRQGRFLARLTVRGRSKSLGTYDTPTEAAAVYQCARKEAFGEFA